MNNIPDTALESFVGLGKEVAEKASKNYWAYEDHHRAEPYAKILPQLREAYVKLKQGVMWYHVLPALAKNHTLASGIWRNGIQGIIRQCEAVDSRDM